MRKILSLIGSMGLFTSTTISSFSVSCNSKPIKHALSPTEMAQEISEINVNMIGNSAKDEMPNDYNFLNWNNKDLNVALLAINKKIQEVSLNASMTTKILNYSNDNQYNVTYSTNAPEKPATALLKINYVYFTNNNRTDVILNNADNDVDKISKKLVWKNSDFLFTNAAEQTSITNNVLTEEEFLKIKNSNEFIQNIKIKNGSTEEETQKIFNIKRNLTEISDNYYLETLNENTVKNKLKSILNLGNEFLTTYQSALSIDFNKEKDNFIVTFNEKYNCWYFGNQLTKVVTFSKMT